MKLSLSTNWCNRRMESGEEIAETALGLGFDELELGFHTTLQQVEGFRRMLDRIPVGSVHAFCPVPLSAPQGYPELYQLASFDGEARAMARLQVRRNVQFAASIGADTVVLHAGRVLVPALPARWREWLRIRRGRKMAEILRRELAELAPDLEKAGVVLGLENLPYAEGFPNRGEIESVAGEWVKPWYDTGHAKLMGAAPAPGTVGLHLNDTRGEADEHLPPGEGAVDFAALRSLAESARHVVFEPSCAVSESRLRRGIARIRRLWNLPRAP